MKLIYFIILIFSSVVNAFADQDWQQTTDENGIKVFIIDVNGTDIIKAKAITEISVTLDVVKNELNTVSDRNQWVPFLIKSEILHKDSEKERIEYSLFSSPWPASDRDFVYELVQVEANSQQHVYRMQSVVHDLMPENGEYIRGEIFESIYTLTRIEDSVTRVELIYHADPKGWLPTWIINIIQKILPYKILENLRDRLETESSLRNNASL